MDDFESIDRSLSQLLANEAQTIILTVGDAGSIVVTKVESDQQAFELIQLIQQVRDTYVSHGSMCCKWKKA